MKYLVIVGITLIAFIMLAGFMTAIQQPTPAQTAAIVAPHKMHFVELPKDKISFNLDLVKVFSETAAKGITRIYFIDGATADYPIAYDDLKKKIAQLENK